MALLIYLVLLRARTSKRMYSFAEQISHHKFLFKYSHETVDRKVSANLREPSASKLNKRSPVHRWLQGQTKPATSAIQKALTQVLGP